MILMLLLLYPMVFMPLGPWRIAKKALQGPLVKGLEFFVVMAF